MSAKFVYDNGRWECKLQHRRCQATNKRGSQCSRITQLTLPYCWQHLQTQANLVIGPTTLRGFDFIGLFACGRDFKRGDTIIEYVGSQTDPKKFQERYPGDREIAPYAMGFLDAACTRGAGSIANSCGTTLRRCNAEYKDGKDGKVNVVATKRIKSGQEILVNYGHEYWLPDSEHLPHKTQNRGKPYNTLKYKCRKKSRKRTGRAKRAKAKRAG